MRTFDGIGAAVSVYDMDGDVLRQLTFSGNAGSPIWSPDDRYIAYDDLDEAGVRQIFRKLADGSDDPEPLSTGERNRVLWSFSTDGKLLAYTEAMPGGDLDIGVLHLDDGSAESFLSGPATDGAPMFSPDGRFLAYGSNAEIYVRHYPSADGLRKISNDGGSYPTWSADGSELYYWNDGSIMVVSLKVEGDALTPGRPQILFSGDFEQYQSFSPYDVAPDAQSFVMLRPAGADAVTDFEPTLVFNWFEELKQRVPTGR